MKAVIYARVSMNIKQIKEKYTCLDYLGESRIVKKLSGGYLCRAPWREDRHPSLSVTLDGRGWQDHSDGTHGNLIDLVAKCIGSTDFRRICTEFDKGISSFETVKNQSDGSKEKRTPFSKFDIVALQSRGLFAYLHQRGINPAIAKKLCSEAHYSFTDQKDKFLYALAFPNDKGGYELRSAFYKGSKSPKGITTHLLGNDVPYVVFEGFFDMLSFATLCEGVKHNYVVLNSVINVDSAIEFLQGQSYDKIYLCLDNDQAGNDATEKMMTVLPRAIDIRRRIAPHKDVNEYLVAHPRCI